MAYETKDGSGALFKNQKQKDTHPDYKGNVRILITPEQIKAATSEGLRLDFELAAWLKKSKTGTTFMSLNAQPKRERTERKEAPPARQDAPFDDDIPF